MHMYNRAGSNTKQSAHTYVHTYVEEDSISMCIECHVHTLYIYTLAPVPLITASNAAGPYGG